MKNSVKKIKMIVEKSAAKRPKSRKVLKVIALPITRKAKEIPRRKLRSVSKRLFFIRKTLSDRQQSILLHQGTRKSAS